MVNFIGNSQSLMVQMSSASGYQCVSLRASKFCDKYS